jgi:hypothetical protein
VSQKLSSCPCGNTEGVQRGAVGARHQILHRSQNLTRDALGLISDRVYRWQLLLEEYAPEIIYIKGIHNTVADANL